MAYVREQVKGRGWASGRSAQAGEGKVRRGVGAGWARMVICAGK